MSLLISGLNLPNDKPVTLFITSNRNVYLEGVLLSGKAVPVPPHGRLGDMDAIARKIRRFGDYVEFTKDEIAGWFENGDFETIIPAEEEAK